MRAELVGVLVAVKDATPMALAPGMPPTLPSGPLLDEDASLQRSTRNWVHRQTGHLPGYLEQLYTFADAGRPGGERTVSVSYLGLSAAPKDPSGWRSWYEVFPWEDLREDGGRARALAESLMGWADEGPDEQECSTRRARVAVTFGLGELAWQPDMVLQRYELLYEAGLLAQAGGVEMHQDHRRILATGLARLRAKIEYRPVVFELLGDEFTLGELQRCVEAIAGQQVHKQNFRRVVETQQLVEETGGRSTTTGGRPAKLFRFRRQVVVERQVIGTKLPVVRTK